LNQIIETKLWKPAGMEADAFVWCGKNHPIYALGAFGQMIYVDSLHNFVAVQTSAQKKGEMGALWDEMLTVFATLAPKSY